MVGKGAEHDPILRTLLGLIWFPLIIHGTIWCAGNCSARASFRATDRITGLVLAGFGASLALKER